MSHKIAGYVLLTAVFVCQAAWSQVQPRSSMERNIRMQGRSNPQRDAQLDMIKQMGDATNCVCDDWDFHAHCLKQDHWQAFMVGCHE